MPWRLLGFILLFAIFLVFIGFNLENSCTISFGFTEFEQVPVYLTTFASFIFGMLCAIPFVLSFKLKKKSKQKAPPAENSEVPALDTPKPEPKRRSKKANNQSDYGID